MPYGTAFGHGLRANSPSGTAFGQPPPSGTSAFGQSPPSGIPAFGQPLPSGKLALWRCLRANLCFRANLPSWRCLRANIHTRTHIGVLFRQTSRTYTHLHSQSVTADSDAHLQHAHSPGEFHPTKTFSGLAAEKSFKLSPSWNGNHIFAGPRSVFLMISEVLKTEYPADESNSDQFICNCNLWVLFIIYCLFFVIILKIN